jgi:proton-dependent oligopeptide transporter, POT family
MTDDGSPPTDEELETLPRVSDKIPYSIFIVVVAEVAERWTFRSLTGPMRKSSHPCTRNDD